MSLKSSIIALAGMVGKCQENSRSLKQCLELGLLEASKDAPGAWTLLGSKTGATKVDIPEGYAELYITVTDSSNHLWLASYVPTAILGENAQRLFNGYSASADVYAYVGVDVKATEAIIQGVITNAGTLTSGCTLNVYGR